MEWSVNAQEKIDIYKHKFYMRSMFGYKWKQRYNSSFDAKFKNGNDQ
jgi:hypothetical protein